MSGTELPEPPELPRGIALAWGLAANPQRGHKREMSVERIVEAAVERILDGVESYVEARSRGEERPTPSDPIDADLDLAADKKVREAGRAVREAEKALRAARKAQRQALREARERVRSS